MVAWLLMAAALGSASPVPAPDYLRPVPMNTAQTDEILQHINNVRTNAGRAPVQRHAGLDVQAQLWAETMARNAQLAHSPNLQFTAGSALGGRYSALAENVGFGRSVPRVMHAFVQSPGHYANIIGRYSMVGIGSARDASGRLWIAMQFAAY
jgi:uncharacterized protein YkwD